MNDWGTTVFVLTYRLDPRYNAAARTLDGSRAVRLIKHRAKEFGIDPERVTLAGFSAGSELTRFVAAAAGPGDANAADPIERVDSKPHSIALVYSTGRTSPVETLAKFPPTFFLSAAADGPANPSAELFVEMNKAGAVAEMHIYQRGRHGFGAATTSPEYGPWMDEFRHFLEQNQFFGPRPAPAVKQVSVLKPATKIASDGYGDLVFVPAGSFQMGDNNGDGETRERPVHAVELDAYYIGKHEVTNAEWKKFLSDPGYDDVKFWPNGRVMPRDQVPYWTQPRNHGGGTPDSDAYPVIGVNWDAASAFCNWISAKTGKKYRLPTEAEWEKAARGTDQRRFPWGNTIDLSYANVVGSQKFDTVRIPGYYDGSVRDGFQTHNGASPYGAMDMAGNVMEWCSDWYNRGYYSMSAKKNPKGPGKGAYRVLRGGAFFFESQDNRSYARSAGWPSLQAWRMIGFRLVREP